jgi:hypothetical protein
MPWAEFNQQLMQLVDETQVHKLLVKEQRGQRRLAYLMRLHSRFNKLRSKREKSELLIPSRGRAQ